MTIFARDDIFFCAVRFPRAGVREGIKFGYAVRGAEGRPATTGHNHGNQNRKNIGVNHGKSAGGPESWR